MNIVCKIFYFIDYDVLTNECVLSYDRFVNHHQSTQKISLIESKILCNVMLKIMTLND